MKKLQLTFGSLFTGIGGFDLGLQRAGLVCKWQVEVDPYCLKVLQKHWPDVPRYGDIRDVGQKELEPVDVVCGGFPCQPFSEAGRQRGKQDDRNLWPEMRRIIDELRPAWVIAENVPGIRNLYLDTVLSDLEGLGYSAGTLDLPAVAFGAPHVRHRLFIIAHAQGEQVGVPGQSWQCEGVGSVAFSEGYGLQGNGTIRQQVADTRQPEIQPQGSYTIMGKPNGVNGRSRARGEDGKKTNYASWWAVEPGMGRVANGVPGRMDRIRTLGNAVVPQVAEWIGCRLFDVAQQIPHVAIEPTGAEGGDNFGE